MPAVAVSITADKQEIVAASTGKSIKLLAFWLSIPASHTFGFRAAGENSVYAKCVVPASQFYIGGLSLGKEVGAVFPVGKALTAHFVGSGTVEVSVLYDYV